MRAEESVGEGERQTALVGHRNKERYIQGTSKSQNDYPGIYERTRKAESMSKPQNEEHKKTSRSFCLDVS